MNFLIKEVSPHIPLKKLKERRKKYEKHLRNLIHAKSSGKSPEETAELEVKIRKIEALITMNLIKTAVVQKALDDSTKRAQSQIDNRLLADAERGRAHERHKKFFKADPRKTVVFVDGQQKEKFGQSIKGGNISYRKNEMSFYTDEKIVDGKVKPKRHKTWSNK